MGNRSHVSLALDAGGMLILAVAGAAITAFKLPLSEGHYAGVFELFSLSFCLAVAILLVSRIIEISVHVSSWEDAKARRQGRSTGYREALNFRSES